MAEIPPILEFDPTPEAVIEPSQWHSPIEGLPDVCVITWMQDAFDRFVSGNEAIERYRFTAETIDNPICEVVVDEQPILIALAAVGAAASAGLIEVLVAIGCRTVLAVGSSGGLTPEYPKATVVVPDGAIRDEGTSYHYAPADAIAHQDPEIQELLATHLTADGFGVVRGLVWTTDAFFRETASKVERRVAAGALAVDMEASALAAVAQFRGIRMGHAVYMADTLYGDSWDGEDLINPDTDFRSRLLGSVTQVAARLS